VVREQATPAGTVYVCDVCLLGYATRETAAECEAFCREFDACSIAITRRAVWRPPA
jgi:hypothetical protein